MNKQLSDVKEKIQRKEELLTQLTGKLASVNAERQEKDELKKKLRNKLSILMGLKGPSEIIHIQKDRTVIFTQNQFLSQSPSEGIQLLIRELQAIEQTLTQEKRVQAIQVQVIPVQFGDDICYIRNTRPDYTFEELCRDAAVYFNQDPTDCVLRDQTTALWPGKAKVKDELETEEDHGIILAPKHMRKVKDRMTKTDAINWQDMAAHAKLEMRLKEMKKWHSEKKANKDIRTRFGHKHGLIARICGFGLYLTFLALLVFVILSQ